MKTNRTINIFCLAVIAAFALTSCHHDDNTNGHTIVYAVQNADTYAGPMSNPTTLSLASDDAWSQQLDDFLDYVQAGNTVTFYNADIAVFNHHSGTVQKKSATKNSHQIRTTNRNEMKEWCRSMEQEGLTVVIDYDEKTGTWSGYAYALPPSMAAQVKSYCCTLGDYGDEVKIVLTADTVNNRLYVTSNYLDENSFNLGVVSYARFNPSDSGIAPIAGRTYLYMASLLNNTPLYGMHYSVVGNSNFDFQTPSFTIVNHEIEPNVLNDSSFAFTTTTGYETWVCEENGYNIVLHIDKSTVSTTSYSFTGQIVIQMNNPMMPVISGDVQIISEGAGSGSEYDENVSMGNSVGGSQYGVELVSDQLVVWHFGSYDWTFVRLM